MFKKCYVIPTRMACNADCVFCSSRFREAEFAGLPEHMAVDADFSRVLHSLTSEPVLKYEITGGGEPFLNRHLQAIVNSIKSALPSAYLKVYTNGHIFRRIEGIDELNISVAHWDTSLNNAIFRLHQPRNIFSVLDFFSPERTYKLRLSIPMIKGGIDDPAKAREMIDKTCLHVDGYVLRPLFPFTPQRADYDGEFHIDDPRVELDYGACGHDNVLLWMPNNKTYRGWNLARERSCGSV
jgi:wyosine [tRNA(Phe)-imidazoG37] synthetase (radical SAM superfamily)